MPLPSSNNEVGSGTFGVGEQLMQNGVMPPIGVGVQLMQNGVMFGVGGGVVGGVGVS